MASRDKPRLDYRHGEEQYRIIEREVVPSLETFKSEKDFTRQAIQNQATSIRSIADGGGIAERLVLLLSDIRGIEEELPDRSAEARIKDEGLTDNMTIHLDEQEYGVLKDITKETPLDKSKAARYCTICQLSKIAQGSDVLSNWQREEIVRTWAELRKSLSRQKLNLYYVLVERFVLNLENTEYFIEHDPRPFEHFAEAYKADFYEFRPYSELQEQLGERVFNNVENTIEEHTEISFEAESGTPGFLDRLQEK